ncbi:anthranilate phosphoribosyltransferase [Hydrogenimonas urashimensis]|uniref:anthranilate phosphoribosyltransferase n=1 Tax=Hydrogenimonas urashimensis TaxID=2740515 RepID=UPI00191554FF|nr:glycosyl transferase [Hydrogenimonas urashimensis]
MSDAFIRYIKCVGTGAKHNRDLTYEEMRDAMEQMLDGRASPEQCAAFLLGWRLKPETATEFRAALDVLDENCVRKPVDNGIELGYPFDGKADNPYIFTLAAPMVAPFGIRVIVNGGALQPSKKGLTVREVCESVPLPENIRYFDQKNYCKPLADLSPIRQKLGLRTGLNTLERLPDAGGCDTALIGVFHKPYVKKYREVFAHRYRRLVIAKGNEGTPEIFGKCRVWVCEGDRCEERIVDPKRFGIDYTKSFDPITKSESLSHLASPSDTLMDIAKLNAGLWLFCKGVAQTIEEGWEMLNDR